jgi:uncharacterized repeat protein (TIGR03803 family)
MGLWDVNHSEETAMDLVRAMPSPCRGNPWILCLTASRVLTASVTLAVATAILVSARAASAQTHLDVLHAFASQGVATNPRASLIQATDGNLYGTTESGGAWDRGTVFEMTPGGILTVLYAFTGGPDGASPEASLIQATDGNLYGTTRSGGGTGCDGGGCGTIFKMTPSGTLTVLHAFIGGTTDGASPYAALIQATDGNFYGTTFGGAAGFGTVFKMTPNGALTVLHAFTDGDDGAEPLGPLIQATDGNFYGTASYGGAYRWGTIFKMTPSGTVAVLHAFGSRPGDGANPLSLIQATDGNFYGTTSYSTSGGGGTVFQMTPGGTVTTMHMFTGGTDGALPYASLIHATDGNFYGTTYFGGASNLGTVFRITPGGSLTVLHAFTPGTDGAHPYGALIQATDGNLYGTTFGDGGASNLGTVFKMTPGGTVTVLHAFIPGTDGAYPNAALIQATDGNFYGTTPYGGTSASGTVFKMTPSGTVSVLHAFTGGTDGTYPYAALIQATDGNFYGTTIGGGSTNCNSYGCGTVFKMTPSGIVTVLHAFTGEATEGTAPEAPLIQATDGNFYGTTYYGGGTGCNDRGIEGCGTIFKMTPAGTVTVLHAFIGGTTEGAYPHAALIQATNGNFYGATGNGGGTGCYYYDTSGCGTVFKMTPGGTVTVLHAFTGGTDGAGPAAVIQANDGNFYGTTASGGASNAGTVFMMTPSGTFTVLHEFSGTTDGTNPLSPLIQATDGNFYGTTFRGDSNVGTVFMMTPRGTLTILHAFGGTTDGGYPLSALIQATDGNYYGATSQGGASGRGVVFRLSPPTVPPAATTLLSPSGVVSTNAPVYTWNKVSDASYYYLWVNDVWGMPVIQTWYNAAVCGATTCSVTPPAVPVSGGRYLWWVETWNSAGYGPWSSSLNFIPGFTATTLIAPSGTTGSTTPSYTWNKVGASYYYLWVSDSAGTPVIQTWYTAASVCPASGGTCVSTPSFGVRQGVTYTWWVETYYDTGGFGPWSRPLSFATGAPPATTLLSPSGAIGTQSPTYTWTTVSSATWYYLWVANAGGAPVIQTWYTAASVCNTSTCAVTPAITLAAGNMHTWWVETYDSLGFGPWSTSLSFTPTVTVP